MFGSLAFGLLRFRIRSDLFALPSRLAGCVVYGALSSCGSLLLWTAVFACIIEKRSEGVPAINFLLVPKVH